MSGTINLPAPPAPYVDTLGVHAPAFSDYITYLTTCMQTIYGTDIYLGNDSQDGQLINIFATVLADQASACVAAYNAYAPSTAQGVGLSSVVKINSMQRAVASYSSVPVIVVGNAGVTLNNALATDGTYNWAIPNGTIIPGSGLITVTATCTTLGAINLAPGGISLEDGIGTPTAGWQSVTNLIAATPGQPVEPDPTLRLRQTSSTMTASQTLLDGMVGNILALSGVVSCVPYENDTSTTNVLGIPPNSIAMVINGGNASAIANLLFTLKAPGANTYGTTSEMVIDAYGVPHTISWFYVTQVPITVVINIINLTNYSTAIGNQIQQSVVNYINSLASGQNVLVPRLWVPAQLQGSSAIINAEGDPDTFELSSVLISRGGAQPIASDVFINFWEECTCSLATVTLNVV